MAPAIPPSPPPPRSPRAPFTAYRLPRGRGRSGIGAVVSFAIHVLVIVAIFWHGAEALLELGAGGAGPRGGGGGGGRPVARFFNLPAASTPVAVDVPPVPAITVDQLPVPDIQVEDLARIEVPKQEIPLTTIPGAGQETGGGPGQGAGTGGGTGTGVGTGTGSAEGPGTGGEGGYIFPANPLGIILPASCARGRFYVRFWVGVDGRVSRVEMNPPPRDAGCRREMTERMMGYKFRPATTRDGQPVASIFRIQLEH
ncbi:MAG: hypothetical protein HYS40_07440 [Gemmatimonadetes bacterium]|nr:hypothetical protein [Gemmatimonadota bacterium]